MGGSSSEHGSVSPDSHAQPDAFFEKVQVPKRHLSQLLRYSQWCSLVPQWCSSIGCWLFLGSGIPSGSQKGFLQRSRVAEEVLLHPVSLFCPLSSLVVPVLPLFHSPLHTSPFLSPLPLTISASLSSLSSFPFLLSFLLAPCLFVSLPQDTMEGVKKGSGDTLRLSHQPSSTSSFPGVSRAEPASLPTHIGIVECLCPQSPRYTLSRR